MARINGITQKEYDEWVAYCDYVQQATAHKLYEKKHEREARVKYLLTPGNYDEYFRYYYPHYCNDGKTPCSRYQTRNFEKLFINWIITLIQMHHRRSAKSVHGNMGYPINLMLQDELWFGVVMGYNEVKSARLIKDIQAELMRNKKLINDFGVQFSHGDWAKGSFMTTKGVAFESMSYIQDPAGMRNGTHRIDFASVDDIENIKKARNQVIVREAADNIISNLKSAMDKDRQRMIISNNRKAKHGVIDRIVDQIGKKKTTHVSFVTAVRDTIDFEPTWPENYTPEYWRKVYEETPSRVWEREYMNNPVEDGSIFKPEWIRWKKPLPLNQYDHLVLYGDLSYTDTGDLKSLHLIGKKGREFHVLEAHNRQTSNSNVARWLYDLYEERLRGVDVVMMIEANFIQGQFLNDFDEEGDQRGYYLPVRGDVRQKGNKFDRIENISPIFERGYVWFDESKKKDPDFEKLVDCLLAFEKGSGAPDDPPDSLEGGFFELNKRSSTRMDKMRVIQAKTGFVD